MVDRLGLVFALFAFFVIPTMAQEPESIPLPIPNPVPNDNSLIERPIADSSDPDWTAENAEVTGLGSILVDVPAGVSDDLPLTAAPAMEDPNVSNSLDGPGPLTPMPVLENTFSSSIGRVDAPRPLEVTEELIDQGSVIRSPQTPPDVPTPIEMPSDHVMPASDAFGSSTRIPSSRIPSSGAVTHPRQTSVWQGSGGISGQPWRMTTIVAETTIDLSAHPNPVRPAMYEQRYRRFPGATEYREIGTMNMAPMGVLEPEMVMSRRIPAYSYGAPAVFGMRVGTGRRMGYGGPLGPAGQPPQPRPLVPGRPIMNFVRGIAPY